MQYIWTVIFNNVPNSLAIDRDAEVNKADPVFLNSDVFINK